LGGSHFVELLPLRKPLQRDFYAEMCRLERWSVRALRAKIGGMLYERTALSRRPAKLAARGIRVAEYLTELPSKKILERKLHEAVRLAHARLARHTARP
jgi:predicted nuclease of restriction endonuclease-like (RecB) superfamily